jgi:tungstate transport system permease protein
MVQRLADAVAVGADNGRTVAVLDHQDRSPPFDPRTDGVGRLLQEVGDPDLAPVVVGLIVYVLFSRAGPLGVLGLLFTLPVMVIAQVLIITPIIASISHQAIRELWAEYHDLLLSLNATPRQRIATLLWDGRRSLLTASLAGFGRAIGEVGAIMIVGGNIDHATRVLTTAIALETGKGNFALALALGFVLIAMAIAVNLVLHGLSRTERSGRW